MRMILLADIVALVFIVFVLVFAASAGASDVRTLPKWVWILLCIFIPVIGGIAYLIWGRPISGQPGLGLDSKSNRGSGREPSNRMTFTQGLKAWLGLEDDDDDRPNVKPEFRYRQEPSGRKKPVAPDDDPEFLRELARKLQEQKDAETKLEDSGDDLGDDLGDDSGDEPDGGKPGAKQ
ncbi:MAG: hypothetical protein RL196_712 [Actinomycetota bacterium]|jgi:hypothetical protein